MLSRSCYRLRTVGKQCLGSILFHPSGLSSSQNQILPLQLSRLNSSSPNPISFDDFSDVINELVKKDDPTSIKFSYVQKLKSVNSLEELQQFCVDCRPSTSQEALLILQRLLQMNFQMNGDAAVTEFLKSESYVSSLSAQFLSDEVNAECLLEAGICFFNILNELPKNKPLLDEDAPLSLTPNFDTFFADFMKALKEKLETADIQKLNADVVFGFYRCLENKLYSNTDADFMNAYKKVLERKIPDITLTSTITAFLASLKKENYTDESFIMLVRRKIEELSPNMLLGELVNVFSTLAENEHRKIEILQVLAEAIRSHSDVLTLSQLERLANAITKISFYHPRLISRYCSDLKDVANNLSRWSQATAILTFLCRARVTDEKLWEKIIKWMNKNLGNASLNDLRFSIGSLALMNIDSKLCSTISSNLASRLQPSPKESPLKWLNIIWSLACLKALTPELAESVLNDAFKKELFSEEHKFEENLYAAQKLFQIRASALYDLKDYHGSLPDVKELNFKPDTCELLKYGTKVYAEKYKSFQKNLTIPIPPKFAIRPRFYPEYGVFIESLVFYDAKTSKFGSIKSIPKDEQQPLKGLIAVQYFNEKHYTAVFTDDDVENRRLLGTYQMGVRHLESAGAKVVIIAEHELEKCYDTFARIEYLKDKIVKTAQKN